MESVEIPRNLLYNFDYYKKRGQMVKMPKLQYVLRRMKEMDYKKMLDTAKTIHQRCGKNTLFLLADMAWCGFRYQAGYMDYLVFEFYTLNGAQRRTYITRGQSNRFVRLLNPRENWHLLEDKIEFLKRFDGFRGRDWIDLRECGPEAFEAFLEKHPKIIVKPLEGTCGRGIEFFEVSGNSRIAGLYDMLRANGQYLVEAVIIQHPDIAKIYPLSVNTLRLVTIRNQDTVHIVFSSMRIGNGLRVDNLNSGGMAVIVDENGIISTPGADKAGKAYYQHPYTGVTLVGCKIPLYQEAVEMVKKAALQIPELGYIAWDVAITETSPLLIEANHFPGHDIYQFQVHLGPDKIGLLPRFEKAIAGLEV